MTIASEAAGPRPKSVVAGVALILGSLPLDVVHELIVGLKDPWLLYVVSDVIGLAIVVGIWRGINICRIAVLLLEIASLMKSPLGGWGTSGRGLLALATDVLTLAGLAALFLPASNQWFRAKTRAKAALLSPARR